MQYTVLVNLFFLLRHRVSNYPWLTKLVHGCYAIQNAAKLTPCDVCYRHWVIYLSHLVDYHWL